MLKTVRASAIILALLIALPIAGFSSEDHPKKYGIDFMLGGSYYNLADVNEFVAHEKLAYIEPDKIHIGTQLGIGLIYRQEDNFGWQFGYNKLFSGVPIAMEQTYKVETTIIGATRLSTVEQKISGSEWYALATWYAGWGQSKELMFGIGPAFYNASLDRSTILYDPNPSAIASGNFTDANGKAMGLIAMIGLELPIGENTGLCFQGGVRSAKVGRVSYDDPTAEDANNTTEVDLNSYSNSKLPIDFSGAFGKITIRTYFSPTSDWRTPERH